MTHDHHATRHDWKPALEARRADDNGDSEVRKGARERIAADPDTEDVCRWCLGSGVEVVGVNGSTRGAECRLGCKGPDMDAMRQRETDRKWKRRFYRAEAAAAKVEVVTRRSRG